MTQRRSGFTLIELLVVVVIIGILASIGVQNMSSAQDKARNSGVLSGTRSVFMGIESFKADYNTLPDDLVGADPAKYIGAPDSATATSFIAKYTPGGQMPTSPWGTKPQEKMDSAYNNSACASRPDIGGLVQSGQPLPMQNGFFPDSGDANGNPPADGHGTQKRSDFGYYYYCGDINSGRYAVFGVGKYKKEARVISVKSNFQ